MAQLNKLQFTVQDDEGNPISGCSVSVRTQGAFVTSTQAGPTYTVNDPGGITTSHTVSPGILGTPVTTVSSVTATTVVTGGAGLGTLANNDRIVVETALPTLYADAQGAETKANPLTTDASGKAFCWIDASKVDVIFTATGYATAIEYDRAAVGSEMSESHIFDSATAIAFRRWTSRTLSTAGALLARWENPKSTLKASIAYDGTIATQGNLTVAGTAAITGATTLTGALTAGAGTFTGLLTSSGSFTYSGVAGSFTLTAGSIETADLAANAVVITRTAVGTADQNINSTAYANANYTNITDCTLTFTPASTASEIVVIATSPIATNAAGIAEGVSAIRDGSDTILHETSVLTGGTSGDTTSSTLIYRVTGLSGSQTFKLSVQFQRNNGKVENSTHAAKKRISSIVAMEFKK